MKRIHIPSVALFVFAGLLGSLQAQTYINHTVNQPPALVADAGSAGVVCSGDSILLGGAPTASGGNGTYSYSWSPTTDLSDPAASNPMASDMGGTYVVVVTDGNGCSTVDSIAVSPLAVSAGFTYVDLLLTVQFTNSSTGGTSYSWSFGDGNTSTSSSPSHTYTADGAYLVCLTVNPGGPCEDSVCTTINVVGTGLAGENKAAILVYPNPSSSGLLNFVVKGGGTDDIMVELYDMAGKMVKHQGGNGLQELHQLSCRGLSQGSYFFKVKRGEIVVGSGKVVLE